MLPFSLDYLATAEKMTAVLHDQNTLDCARKLFDFYHNTVLPQERAYNDLMANMKKDLG
jgi:hypothetical protein